MTTAPRLALGPALIGIALLGLAPGAKASIVLSDNTTQASGGTTDVSGSNYLASSFTTDGSSYTLNSVALLGYTGTAADRAELDVYTDAGLEPSGTMIGSLAASSYTSSLGLNTFTSTNTISLAAGSTYWVVLRALSGDFFWSFTDSDTGTGAGFSESSDSSPDAGSSWFNYQSEPNQLLVTATVTGAASVPEPASIALLGLGLIGSVVHRSRRARASA